MGSTLSADCLLVYTVAGLEMRFFCLFFCGLAVTCSVITAGRGDSQQINHFIILHLYSRDIYINCSFTCQVWYHLCDIKLKNRSVFTAALRLHCSAFVRGLCWGPKIKSLKMKLVVLKCLSLVLECIQSLETVGALKNVCI